MIYALNPTDLDNYPDPDPSCETCKRIKAEPYPGLLTWLSWVARHMDKDHDIQLVGA